MAVRVTVMGQVSVEHDGARVSGGALQARRSRLLLVSLATTRGPLRAEVLAARIWADPPPTWGAALRGAVAALRASLAAVDLPGQQLVVTDPTGWRMAEGTETDLTAAVDAVHRADAALVADRPATALDLAEGALVACADDVLPGDDGDWIDQLREHRAVTLGRALGIVVDAALAVGATDRAVEAARSLVTARPLDETAHRRLMRTHLEAGNRSAAVQAFEACRATLAEDLGVDPDDDTSALYLQVLQSGSPRGRAPRPPPDRFVGRVAEVRATTDALARGRWVTLVGPGGIGKSRLALHVLHDPALRAAGRYWAPLGDVADSGLVPSVVGAAVGVENGPDPLREVVERLAPTGPAVLVLDGCERHRDAVAEAVGQLVEQVPELVVLCTSRARLGGAEEHRIVVGPLEDAVDLLVARVAEGPSDRRLSARDTEAARELCRRVAGVPLAVELAAARLQDLAIGDLLDETAVVGESPGRVLRTLAEQGYEALDPDEARLLHGLAAVEGVLPLTLVRALVTGRLPPQRVARLLGTLSETGFVVVDRDGVRWRYGVDAHLRDLARRRSTPAELAAALARIARALDAVVPTDPTAAPAPFRTGVDAARDALRSVFAAAADGTLPREDGLALAFRLHRHWASTGLAEGRLWLGRLLDGAPPSPGAARARFAAGYLAYWAGDPAGLPLLRRAGDELAEDEPAFAARALLYAAGLSDDLDQPAHAEAEVTRAVALARRLGGGLVASTELGRATVLAERGDPAAVAAIDRALALLPATAPDDQVAAIAATGALAAWRAGDPDAARRLGGRAGALLTGGPSISRAVLALAEAGSALTGGDAGGARTRAEEALADLQSIGADREVPLAAALATRAAADAGDQVGARRHALVCLQAARLLGVPAAAALALEAHLAAHPDDAAAPVLAASAAAVRRAGSRPPPPGLAPAAHPPADPLPPADALQLALGVPRP